MFGGGVLDAGTGHFACAISRRLVASAQLQVKFLEARRLPSSGHSPRFLPLYAARPPTNMLTVELWVPDA